MTDIMTQGVEVVEEIGPQMSGTLGRMNNTQGYGFIKDENGKEFIFSFGDCVEGIDTFNQLKDGMVMTFNERLRNYKGELINRDRYGLGSAINVTSDEISTAGINALVPEVKTTIGQIMTEPYETQESLYVEFMKTGTPAIIEGMESLENMGPQTEGTIKVMKLYEDSKKGFGFIIPADGQKDIFFHSLTCAGGIDTFKTLYEACDAGNKMKVSFNPQDSRKGPMALNVTIKTV